MLSLTSTNLQHLRNLWQGCELPPAVKYAEVSFDCNRAAQIYDFRLNAHFERVLIGYCEEWSLERNTAHTFWYDHHRRMIHVYAKKSLRKVRRNRHRKPRPLSDVQTGTLLRSLCDGPTPTFGKKSALRTLNNRIRNVPIATRYAIFERDRYSCRSCGAKGQRADGQAVLHIISTMLFRSSSVAVMLKIIFKLSAHPAIFRSKHK